MVQTPAKVVFDQAEQPLPVPDFTAELQLKVNELVGWLVVRVTVMAQQILHRTARQLGLPILAIATAMSLRFQ